MEHFSYWNIYWFSKGFDTIDHSIPLFEFDHYGVHGTAYDWFCGHFQNITQLYFFNDFYSRKRICYMWGTARVHIKHIISNICDTNKDLRILIYNVNVEFVEVINW